jgi:3-oxoacid CoA-transferase B subunit
MRVAKELFDGAVVNLGIGIPTQVSNYIPEERAVIFQSENGVLGYGQVVDQGGFSEKADIDFINAGGQYITPMPGMCFFNLAESFDMIRGGHIDVAILGAIEVSEKGDLANWMIPSRKVGGIGGGMDLAFNTKKVIVAIEHTTKDGKPKIVKRCRAPLTAPECVDLIVTDIAVIEVTRGGLLLKEFAPGWHVQEIQALTEPKLHVAEDLREMEL